MTFVEPVSQLLIHASFCKSPEYFVNMHYIRPLWKQNVMPLSTREVTCILMNRGIHVKFHNRKLELSLSKAPRHWIHSCPRLWRLPMTTETPERRAVIPRISNVSSGSNSSRERSEWHSQQPRTSAPFDLNIRRCAEKFGAGTNLGYELSTYVDLITVACTNSFCFFISLASLLAFLLLYHPPFYITLLTAEALFILYQRHSPPYHITL